MKLLIQRVSRAAVRVCEGAREVGRIGRGVLAFLGVEKGDGPAQAARLAERVAEYRIFPDDAGRMNRSLLEAQGEALVVSQFTLCASTRKGTRPGFDRAAPPEAAEALYRDFCRELAGRGVPVRTGVFGAMMEVELTNDGPVTFLLEAAADGG